MSARDLHAVIGTQQLSAWRVAPGVMWVQTRVPALAQKLKQRSDSRSVVTGVAGGYLRTFEFEGKTHAWARKLVARYLAPEPENPEPAPAC